MTLTTRWKQLTKLFSGKYTRNQPGRTAKRVLPGFLYFTLQSLLLPRANDMVGGVERFLIIGGQTHGNSAHNH
jgi:hypothetical protein